MKKSDFVDLVARNADIPIEKAEKVVDATLHAIIEELRKEGSIFLPGYGTFALSKISPTGSETFLFSPAMVNDPNPDLIAYGEPMQSGMLSSDRRSLILRGLKETGSTYNILSRLVEQKKIPIKFLAEKVFEVTPKTVSKYRSQGSGLPSTFVELAIKLEILFELGFELFGSYEEFIHWLSERAYGLGGHIPEDMLNTSTGIELVYEELKRIEFGATA